MNNSELQKELNALLEGADDWASLGYFVSHCPKHDPQEVINLLNWMFARGVVRRKKIIRVGKVHHYYKEYRYTKDGTIEP